MGQGATARVFLAEHIRIHALRAIKQIPKQDITARQVMQEVQILKNLRHPGIPLIYDVEEDEKYSYIIEEYLEGKSLKAYRLERESIREKEILHLIIPICELIQYLHECENPIVYLDLKPENIMVCGNSLKLVDFGACAFLKEQKDQRKFSMGTVGYAAPEQYLEQKPDRRSDIYGIGALLLFLMGTRSGYSECLCGIVDRCMQQEPCLRFQTIRELRENCMILQHTGSLESLDISIAGAQPRTGTTYVSHLITSYLNRNGIQTIYKAYNLKTLKESRNRYDETEGWPAQQHTEAREHPGIYRCGAYPARKMLTRNKVKVTVRDFGVLTEQNKANFLNADLKCIVMGSNDRELEQGEQAIRRLAELADVQYLFNFTGKKRFRWIEQNMKGHRCVRIPLIPRGEWGWNNREITAFAERLLEQTGLLKRKRYNRAGKPDKNRKGLESDEKTNSLE